MKVDSIIQKKNRSKRVLYGINLILWYIRILQMVSCVPFWGPKIIIIKVMLTFLLYNDENSNLTHIIYFFLKAMVCEFKFNLVERHISKIEIFHFQFLRSRSLWFTCCSSWYFWYRSRPSSSLSWTKLNRSLLVSCRMPLIGLFGKKQRDSSNLSELLFCFQYLNSLNSFQGSCSVSFWTW